MTALTNRTPMLIHVRKKTFNAFRTITSFEFVFFLFCFCGLFKAYPAFQSLPVDLTAIMFLLSAGLAGWLLFNGRVHLNRRLIWPIVALSLFLLWQAASLIWSPSTFWGPEKTIRTATLTVWGFIGAAIVSAPELGRRERLLSFSLPLTGIIGLDALLNYNPRYTFETMSAESGASYLAISQSACIALLICLHRATSQRSGLWMVLYILFAAFFLYLMLKTGGRSPLLAVIVATAVMFMLPLSSIFSLARHRSLVGRSLKRTLLVVAALAVTVAWVLSSGETLPTIHRLLMWQETGVTSDTSEFAREYLVPKAVQIWLEYPLYGIGSGGFSIAAGLGDSRGYPHNIFLEILSETGMVGLILFVLFLWFALRDIFQVARLPDGPVLLCCALSLFIIAQSSSTLPDHRMLFAFLGLVCGAGTLLHSQLRS